MDPCRKWVRFCARNVRSRRHIIRESSSGSLDMNSKRIDHWLSLLREWPQWQIESKFTLFFNEEYIRTYFLFPRFKWSGERAIDTPWFGWVGQPGDPPISFPMRGWDHVKIALNIISDYRSSISNVMHCVVQTGGGGGGGGMGGSIPDPHNKLESKFSFKLRGPCMASAVYGNYIIGLSWLISRIVSFIHHEFIHRSAFVTRSFIHWLIR